MTCSVPIKKRDRFRQLVVSAATATLTRAKSVGRTPVKLMGSLTISVVTAPKDVKQGARQAYDNVLGFVWPFVETSLAVVDRVIFPSKVYAAGTRGAKRLAARAIFASMTLEQRDDYFFQMAEYRLQIQCDALGYQAKVVLAAVGTSPDLSLASR